MIERSEGFACDATVQQAAGLYGVWECLKRISGLAAGPEVSFQNSVRPYQPAVRCDACLALGPHQSALE